MLMIILIILVVILLSYRDLIDAVISFDTRTFDNFCRLQEELYTTERGLKTCCEEIKLEIEKKRDRQIY